jgi:adenosylcobyric acid synthase
MLGQSVQDPHHVESNNDSAEGLGLLPTITTFARAKATYQVHAKILSFASLTEEMIQGYEIHMGETQSQTHWLEIASRNGASVNVLDGSVSPSGKVWGCYIHGLFANDSFRHAWLTRLGWNGHVTSQAARFEESLEKLADAVEGALNIDLLEKIISGLE